MATCTENPTAATRPKVTFGEIPLSKITVAEGFNPRGEVVEDTELQQMAATMRERGCLQAIRVRAVEETGEYVLIAGERRYRAAALAALTTVPAAIVNSGSGDEAEYLDLLTDAMIENESRSDLDALQRARGYQAMIDGGLSIRGVAERLGGRTRRGSREKRIKEHLLILRLPEKLRKLVADQTIPLFAVKTLVELAVIHEELAYAALTATEETEFDEAYTWQEIVEKPIEIAVNCMEDLPAGVYSTGCSYSVARFSLSEKATKDLAAYSKLTGGQISEVRFTKDLLEQARLLDAVRGAGWCSLILGDDVATRLAEDYIALVLKEARARARRAKEAAKANGGSSDTPLAASRQDTESDDLAGVAADSASQAEDAAAERKAADAERKQAEQFNLELGVLAFKHLSKLKVDDRLLRIFASVDLSGSLGKIAFRGARLALPTWVEEKQQKNNKTKMVYLDAGEAYWKASSFLEGASGAGEIAGRAFTLIALASLADENAIAKSNRSFYTLYFQGPWAIHAARDLNAVVRERIKEGQCEALDALLDRRIAKDIAEAEAETQAEEARALVEQDSKRISELSEEQLDQLIENAQAAFGDYSVDKARIVQAVTAEREHRAEASDAADEPGSSELAQAA